MKVALLWVAAAAISGFTLRRYLGPVDEGILMQAATRMSHGEWPWRDFSWAYGPGQPLFVLLAGKLFGPSLLWWRFLRVAADATISVLVYRLAPRWALLAWAAAAVITAQPTSANPTAPALAFALAAVLLATRERAAWAGVAAAAAAFWRPDMGAYAALAVAVTLVPQRRAAIGLAVAVASSLVIYAPFLIAAGPGHVWNALVVQGTRDGAWWRLPFPNGFHESPTSAAALKDFAGWLAPYAALLAVVLAIRRRSAGLIVLSLGATAYFLSRADEEHAQTLLVLACALAAFARPKPAGAAILALLLAVGAANRASALLRPPHLERLHVKGAPVDVTPQDARTLPKLVATVQALVPPGQPIYVAPKRSDLVSFNNPLLHFLTDRPNVLRRDFLLQAKPEEQRNIVAALERARPKAIVRWTDPASATPEPNRRGRPSGSRALDDYLDAHYRVYARYGYYVVLVPY